MNKDLDKILELWYKKCSISNKFNKYNEYNLLQRNLIMKFINMSISAGVIQW